LAGTYAKPTAPVAAALVITGSGKINRDSDARLMRTGVTRAVAEALASVQVSTLRYDKRGVGASGGDYPHAGMAENLADARAGLAWLAGRSAGLPLLAVGLSEGTYYAAQLAADGSTAGVVLLGAPARPGEQVIGWQIEMLAARLPAAARVIMRLTGTDFTRSQHKRLARLKASPADVIRLQGFRANARWFRDFLSYDPSPVLARITVPVLAVAGGHDLQVPPEDVDAIGRLVRGPFEGHALGDLSHLLRPDPEPKGPAGYRRAVRQPVSPQALAIITGWVARHWPGTAAGGEDPADRR
jgi:pimeloyl-ACP methyl ester carboxylesterase